MLPRGTVRLVWTLGSFFFWLFFGQVTTEFQLSSEEVQD